MSDPNTPQSGDPLAVGPPSAEPIVSDADASQGPFIGSLARRQGKGPKPERRRVRLAITGVAVLLLAAVGFMAGTRPGDLVFSLGALFGMAVGASIPVFLVASILSRLAARAWLGPAEFGAMVAALFLAGAAHGRHGTVAYQESWRASAPELMAATRRNAAAWQAALDANRPVGPYVTLGHDDDAARFFNFINRLLYDNLTDTQAFQQACKDPLNTAIRPETLAGAGGFSRARQVLAVCRAAAVTARDRIADRVGGLATSVAALNIDSRFKEGLVKGVSEGGLGKRDEVVRGWNLQIQALDENVAAMDFLQTHRSGWRASAGRFQFYRQRDLEAFQALQTKIQAEVAEHDSLMRTLNAQSEDGLNKMEDALSHF
jgi:hypothetical protein